MNLRMKRPSPAFVVAMVALFVALGGTAGAVVTAAVPLAKRALVADNAKKVGGTHGRRATAGRGPQLRWRSRSHPPDHALRATGAGLVSIKSAPFALAANGQGAFTATCDAGYRRRSAVGSRTRSERLSRIEPVQPEEHGWSI